MLSLSPRYDLFRFMIPRDYIPEYLIEKYNKILSHTSGVLTNAVDYLNESIQGVNIPGISDIIHEQSQISFNSIRRDNRGSTGLGRINIEPSHPNMTYNSENPLSKIEHEITIKFRLNQGFYNWCLLYEVLLARVMKPELYEHENEMFEIELLNELGTPTTIFKMYQPKISGLDGIEFDYSKTERQMDTFTATITFNNVDIDFIIDK